MATSSKFLKLFHYNRATLIRLNLKKVYNFLKRCPVTARIWVVTFLQVYKPLQCLPTPLPLLHDRRESGVGSDDRTGARTGTGWRYGRQALAEDAAL